MTQISDLTSTSSWVKFFTESGIPQSVAANYAVTFVDNRITKQMLLDLNKEILHDMGVVVMGDIIAILKHAKVVHAQLTREKVFKGELSMVPVPPARRAVPAVARVTANEETQTKPAKEPQSQVTGLIKKLPVKRKLEVEATQYKKLRVVKSGSMSTESKSPRVALVPDTTNKSTIGNVTVKPSVFQRLSGGNSTSVAAGPTPKQNILVLKRPSVKETSSSASSVFDRLGPQIDTSSEHAVGPPIKSKRIYIDTDSDIEDDEVPSVKKASFLNRKIVFSASATKPDSTVVPLSKKIGLTNRLGTSTSVKPDSTSSSVVVKKMVQTKRVATRQLITNPSRGTSQGIFASDSLTVKSDPIRGRLGLSVKKPTVTQPASVGRKPITTLRQDMEVSRSLKPLISDRLSVRGGGGGGAKSKRMVSTVSGSVFSRLGR